MFALRAPRINLLEPARVIARCCTVATGGGLAGQTGRNERQQSEREQCLPSKELHFGRVSGFLAGNLYYAFPEIVNWITLQPASRWAPATE